VAISVRRWGVFNLVGLGGFLVQLTAIALLTRRFGWPVAAATAVGFEAAIILNFCGHSRWTWADRTVQGARASIRRWWRFQVTKGLSLGLNVAITQALASGGLPVELANVLAVAICALPNFIVADRLVFVGRRQRHVSPRTSGLHAAQDAAKQNGCPQSRQTYSE
jgi:putative flippase GtrA